MNNPRLGSITIAIAVLFSLTSISFAQDVEQKMGGFNIEGFDKEGSVSWDVYGDTADIMGSKIKLTNVNANSYGENKVNVVAETGTIDQESGNLVLREDVIITSEEGVQLITDELDWDRNEDLVSTEDDVVITDDKFTASGEGMKAKPGLKNAQIEKNVTVRVDTSKEEEQEDYVMITSDGPMTINQLENKAVFEDNVVAVQTDRTLKADRLEVYFTENMEDIKEIICIGNVEIQQGENQSFAEKAIYNATEQKLVLMGRPKLRMNSSMGNGTTAFRN